MPGGFPFFDSKTGVVQMRDAFSLKSGPPPARFRLSGSFAEGPRDRVFTDGGEEFEGREGGWEGDGRDVGQASNFNGAGEVTSKQESKIYAMSERGFQILVQC